MTTTNKAFFALTLIIHVYIISTHGFDSIKMDLLFKLGVIYVCCMLISMSNCQGNIQILF